MDPDDEVAAHLRESGLVAPAPLRAVLARLAAERAAGRDVRLLDLLDGVVAPAPLAALRARVAGSEAGTVAAPGTSRLLKVPLAEAGDRIGPYRLERELGRGGMGVVYLAEQEQLKRKVALKVRLGTAGGDPAERTRFLREAEAASRLRHPNIVGVLETGRDAADHPWIAMEYVDGEALDRTVQREGPRPIDDVVRIGAALASGLAHAHAQGVLHRDLKPANVMVRWSDRAPLITDFGLAKVLAAGAESLTKTGDVLGSPSYMPPEQARGQRVDARADVWALGATLYHLVCGHPPFAGQRNLMATLALVQRGRVPSPRRSRRDLPRPLEAVLLRCLEPDLSRHYPTAQAVADDLQRVAKDEPTEAEELGYAPRSLLPVILLIALGLGAGLVAGLVIIRG